MGPPVTPGNARVDVSRLSFGFWSPSRTGNAELEGTAEMIPRSWLSFFGVLLLGVLLSSWVVRGLGSVEGYWTVVFVAAVMAGLAARQPGSGVSGSGRSGRGAFLCDSCKYDHPDLCSRPERPNAMQCPDYKRRGS